MIRTRIFNFSLVLWIGLFIFAFQEYACAVTFRYFYLDRDGRKIYYRSQTIEMPEMPDPGMIISIHARRLDEPQRRNEVKQDHKDQRNNASIVAQPPRNSNPND